MDRCLRRQGVSVLKDLIPAAVGQELLKKTFKDDPPGFLHVDIKYLPQMPDAHQDDPHRQRQSVHRPIHEQKKTPSGKHAFDLVCANFSIDHCLIRARHRQTDGMIERFNGRISDLVRQTRFVSAAKLESKFTRNLATYNHSIPQRALHHQTPIQAHKAWRKSPPDLFVKNVYEHAGLDSFTLQLHRDATLAHRAL